MSFRPPFPPTSRRSGADDLSVEIQAEQAASLGRAGRRVEAGLAALAAHAGAASERQALVAEAAEAVWFYFVQRETMGFRRHDDAVRLYRIPGEVLARLGAS